MVDDQRGSPTWTRDLAAQLVRLMDRAEYGIYHVTNGGACTWYELAAHALACAGVEASLERTDSASFRRPAPRPANSVLSNTFAEHVTGVAMPPWQDAVRRYLAEAAPA